MIPDPSRDPDESKPIAFSYQVNSVDNNDTVHIKIDFDDPHDLSIYDSYDRLKLSVNRTAFKKAFLIMGN